MRNDGVRWYVSIGVDTKTTTPPKRIGGSVGIDMGVKDARNPVGRYGCGEPEDPDTGACVLCVESTRR